MIHCGSRTPIVSIVVPTYNSERFIEACLSSVRAQTFPQIELIVVDGFSSDRTVDLARAFTERVYRYGPDQAKRRVFGAPQQRNYGASMASGDYIYYLDVDMVLPRGLVEECVDVTVGSDLHAVIVPERSFGLGFWAKAKALERACYLGDDFVEAPRFVRRDVWEMLGGLDTNIGGGGDDWDLHIRLRRAGFSVGRVRQEVLHNEGRLTLARLIKKRYLYGSKIPSFVKRHGFNRSFQQYNPLRRSYLRNRGLFMKDPAHALGFVVMRTVEYAAGGVGLAVSVLSNRSVKK
jgi:glycosyltransferase involved in cell wall biosynthesis